MNKNLKIVVGAASVAFVCMTGAMGSRPLTEASKGLFGTYLRVEKREVPVQSLRESLEIKFQEDTEIALAGENGLGDAVRAVKPVILCLNDEAREQFLRGLEATKSSLLDLLSSVTVYNRLLTNVVAGPEILVGTEESGGLVERIASLQQEKNEVIKKNEELLQRMAVLQRTANRDQEEGEADEQDDSVREKRDALFLEQLDTIRAVAEKNAQQIDAMQKQIEESFNRHLNPIKEDLGQVLENSLQ